MNEGVYMFTNSLTLSLSPAVIPVLRRDNLLWLSVGDGSLFIRDGTGAVPYKLSFPTFVIGHPASLFFLSSLSLRHLMALSLVAASPRALRSRGYKDKKLKPLDPRSSRG